MLLRLWRCLYGLANRAEVILWSLRMLVIVRQCLHLLCLCNPLAHSSTKIAFVGLGARLYQFVVLEGIFCAQVVHVLLNLLAHGIECDIWGIIGIILDILPVISWHSTFCLQCERCCYRNYWLRYAFPIPKQLTFTSTQIILKLHQRSPRWLLLAILATLHSWNFGNARLTLLIDKWGCYRARRLPLKQVTQFSFALSLYVISHAEHRCRHPLITTVSLVKTTRAERIFLKTLAIQRLIVCHIAAALWCNTVHLCLLDGLINFFCSTGEWWYGCSDDDSLWLGALLGGYRGHGQFYLWLRALKSGLTWSFRVK